MWRKRSGEVALAGEDRTARHRKVESRSGMALRRDEKAGAVERGGRPKDQTVAAGAAWLNRKGMTPRSECAWRKRRRRQASRRILED
jgi:restriction endonuclease Mrr